MDEIGEIIFYFVVIIFVLFILIGEGIAIAHQSYLNQIEKEAKLCAEYGYGKNCGNGS